MSWLVVVADITASNGITGEVPLDPGMFKPTHPFRLLKALDLTGLDLSVESM
jgi:hypothetical protein